MAVREFGSLYFQLEAATLEETGTLSSSADLHPAQGPDFLFSFDKSNETPLYLLF